MRKSLLFFVLFFLMSCTPQNTSEENAKQTAVIETSKGNITVELSDRTPITTGNFVGLAKDGFYDGLTFHRVEPGFVIQGGDPNGNGTGGSDQQIELEIPCADGTVHVGTIAPRSCEIELKHRKGAFAMARSQNPNSASSQFYIALEDNASISSLDGKYAVFGYVVKGIDVAGEIEIGDRIEAITVK